MVDNDINGDEAMKNLDDAMDKIFRKKAEDTEEIIADQEDEEVTDD